MIQRFVDRFLAAKDATQAELALAHPEAYGTLVKQLVKILAVQPEDEYDPVPDLERIVEINHGHYQGTLLYVIGATGYQPSTYFVIYVGYGSCSGCDTLQAIGNYDSDPPNASQVNDYWTLMLHMVQKMKQLDEYDESV